MSVIGLSIGFNNSPAQEILGHLLGASGKIFLKEERHTGTVSNLMQVSTAAVADGLGAGRQLAEDWQTHCEGRVGSQKETGSLMMCLDPLPAPFYLR